MLMVLLEKPEIMGKLLLEGEIAQSVSVLDDGSILLSKSKYVWWSKIFNDIRVISFNDLAIQIIEVLSGVGKSKNEIVLNGLRAEFTDLLFKQNDKNRLIETFMVVLLVGADGGATYLEIPTDESEYGISFVTYNSKLEEKETIIPLTRFGKKMKKK